MIGTPRATISARPRQACSRAVRLVALLRDLQAHPHGLTARQLAARLQVTVRTVQRDLADVQAEPLRAALWQDEEWRWHALDVRGPLDVWAKVKEAGE